MSKTLDDIINSAMERQLKGHALKKMLATLHHLDLIDLCGVQLNRINDDVEWRNMGCPDAEFILTVNYYDKDKERHRSEVLL